MGGAAFRVLAADVARLSTYQNERRDSNDEGQLQQTHKSVHHCQQDDGEYREPDSALDRKVHDSAKVGRKQGRARPEKGEVMLGSPLTAPLAICCRVTGLCFVPVWPSLCCFSPGVPSGVRASVLASRDCVPCLALS